VEALDGPAAMYNHGVQHARGEGIGLLSGDLEVISPEWLGEMVSHALRPGVGAVGALLYYPDDTIQHAGIILGGEDVARAAYAHKPRGYTGQIGRAALSQNLSAVSAACLVLRRDLFLQAGGFDDKRFPSELYDVDLCLRLAERGYRTVWTPYAELYHHTPIQRERSERGEQWQTAVTYLRQRWKTILRCDPTYNLNLALEGGRPSN
jgi:GT2 family glycosyltransferase